MLIRAGTVDLAPRRSTTVVPAVSFPPVSLPAATAPVPQRGTASVKSSPSQKFPSSSPAALLPDAARSRTASVLLQSLSCLQSLRSRLTTLFGPALPGVVLTLAD